MTLYICACHQIPPNHSRTRVKAGFFLRRSQTCGDRLMVMVMLLFFRDSCYCLLLLCSCLVFLLSELVKRLLNDSICSLQPQSFVQNLSVYLPHFMAGAENTTRPGICHISSKKPLIPIFLSFNCAFFHPLLHQLMIYQKRVTLVIRSIHQYYLAASSSLMVAGEVYEIQK